MPGKLTYFGLQGRAEAIRSMLAHGNVDYEDCRVEQDKAAEMKESGESPLGSLPIWQEDGFTVCQSNAILRMMGIRHGYYTTDPTIAYQIDSLCDLQEDIVNKFFGYLLPVLGGGAPGDATDFLASFWDKQIGVVQGRLQASCKPFAAGTDRPTIADFKLFAQVSCVLPECNPACVVPADVQPQIQAKIDAAPEYKAWVERMKTELSAYLASRAGAPL
eukprot:Macronucleus_2825.p2 GENE.Macronucleus_2825~~Macronucleus_2825.p2  ORF type:complete len:218 (+),score=74.43 Macronucleus_2825:1-654(+)